MSEEEKTDCKVFIIESLNFDDEKNNRLDGYLLHQMLQIAEIKSEYYYIRTSEEYEKILEFFQESNARYLHISCHGSNDEISFTLGGMSLFDFAEITSQYLERKRIFISACESVNNELASYLIPSSGCFSLIGPNQKIRFDDSAIVWSSFYHLALKDKKHMNQKIIKPILKKISDTFNIDINYYSVVNERNLKHKTHSRKYNYIPNLEVKKDWVHALIK